MMHFDGIEEQFYWNMCACNEVDAIMRRHYLPVEYAPSSVADNLCWDKLDEEMRAIADSVTRDGVLEKVDHNTLMRHTRAKIRGRYKAAYDSIREGRVVTGAADSTVEGFVKYEKIPVGKLEDNKPPRLIQFRSFEYLYQLKSYILAFDIRLKEASDILWNGQNVKTILTKMHDNYGVAACLRENWDYFVDPVAICKDANKFDGRYKRKNLEAEHKMWLRMFRKPRGLRALLSAQLTTKGRTANGVRYKGEATRCSGEFTTSDGNGTSNYSYLALYCKASGLKPHEFRICVNGDDSVLFVDRSNLHKLLPDTWFLNYGMVVETDRICDSFCEISYCQAQPIRVKRDDQLVWYMVKEPHRAISRMCFAPSEHLNCVDRYLSSVGLCELAVSAGVPVMQAFSMRVMELGNFSRPLGAYDRYPALLSGNTPAYKEIEPETRRDYEEAFGVSVLDQLEIEDALAGSLRTNPLFTHYTKKYTNFVLKSSHLQ